MGKGLLGDTELMQCLRRVNLDAFWSRKPTTIKHNLGKVNRALQIAHELGMRDPPMPKVGPSGGHRHGEAFSGSGGDGNHGSI
jgi:hypothetical protein